MNSESGTRYGRSRLARAQATAYVSHGIHSPPNNKTEVRDTPTYTLERETNKGKGFCVERERDSSKSKIPIICFLKKKYRCCLAEADRREGKGEI